jgi:hypothetical protein
MSEPAKLVVHILAAAFFFGLDEHPRVAAPSFHRRIAVLTE